MKQEQLVWHWYAGLNQITLREREQLLAGGLSPKELFACRSRAAAEELLERAGCRREADGWKRLLAAVLDETGKEQAEQEMELFLEKGMKIAARSSPEYPKRLRHISLPPFCLYYYGMLPEEEAPAIAIVGARNCSTYGEELAACFAAGLAEAGVQIISGLARGVDASAGRAAINRTGRAYAVMGCGVDICYPKENKQLYELHKEKGGILSEEPPQSAPLAYRFPKRNRLISALSDGVLVVEAAERSGSLITAEYALEQGKDIYAVPGRCCDRLSAGCNRLIQAGARLVCEPEEILLALPRHFLTERTKGTKEFFLETNEKKVYACLSLHPKHMEELAQELALALPELSCVLFQMEMKHYIRQVGKNYYIKNLTNSSE